MQERPWRNYKPTRRINEIKREESVAWGLGLRFHGWKEGAKEKM